MTREEYKLSPKECLFCKEVIPFEKKRSKFCGHSCRASFSSNRKGTGKGPRVCETCGIEILTGARNCAAHRTHGKWKPFENLNNDGTRKKRLLEERGHRCECCGLSEWMERPIVLTLEHTDGNPDNNDKINLKLLCWNCHSMTPTFGAKNKNRFPNAKRTRRRQTSRVSR